MKSFQMLASERYYKKDLGRLNTKELATHLYELELLRQNFKKNNLHIEMDIIKNNDTFQLVAVTTYPQ